MVCPDGVLEVVCADGGVPSGLDFSHPTKCRPTSVLSLLRSLTWATRFSVSFDGVLVAVGAVVVSLVVSLVVVSFSESSSGIACVPYISESMMSNAVSSDISNLFSISRYFFGTIYRRYSLILFFFSSASIFPPPA